MELFGIHKGIIVSAVGEKLTPAKIKSIAKACAVSLLEPTEKKEPEKKKNSYKDLPLKDRKKLFYNKLIQWKEENKGKYPDHFYPVFFDYWTQTDSLSNSEEMRFEKVVKQKGAIFNFGGRLATFWRNLTDQQKSEYWMKDQQHKAEQEKKNQTNNQNLFT